MWVAHIACSDPQCTEELEWIVEKLDDLDGYACACGYGYVVLALAEEPELALAAGPA